MSAAQALNLLGQPNIVNTDDKRREVDLRQGLD